MSPDAPRSVRARDMAVSSACRNASSAVVAPDDDALLDAAIEIARQAGALVATAMHEAHEESYKGSAHNVVTDVDRASEALIVAEIRRRFPEHAIVAEEGGGTEGEGVTWFVDPLDGTNNFAHGYPVFAVNLAAMRGGDVAVAVTYDPSRQELFTARRGAGAWLNGQRIAVSSTSRLDESLVATGFPYDKATNPDNNLAQLAAVVPHVRGIRRGGSAALDLAYVACGRLDGYWERGVNAWDVAPGILLIEEAGGLVTDYNGRPPDVHAGRFVATNGHLHPALMALLRLASAGPAA